MEGKDLDIKRSAYDDAYENTPFSDTQRLEKEQRISDADLEKIEAEKMAKLKEKEILEHNTPRQIETGLK